jgi:transaldolase
VNRLASSGPAGPHFRHQCAADAFNLVYAETQARVASVASFFVSRVDAMVDPLLGTAEASLAGEASAARGMVAVAGARTLRLLWASTSSKDPKDSDIKYLEALIGPDTVNTAPPGTLDAYLDHGRPEAGRGGRSNPFGVAAGLGH